MTVIIPPNATEKQIETALEKLNKESKKFDVDKFFGKMQWGKILWNFNGNWEVNREDYILLSNRKSQYILQPQQKTLDFIERFLL